jgi:uncharacterized membrane protein
MLWAIATVQWLHVFLGIFWFGSVLFVDFVVIPSITSLPMEQQGPISQKLAANSNKVILPVAALVILIGILRGTVWGQVQSFDVLFGTQYGITFFISLLLGLGVYAWGYFITRPAAERINKLGSTLVDGKPTPAFAAAVQRVKMLTFIELFGFLAVFTTMILMRFGL